MKTWIQPMFPYEITSHKYERRAWVRRMWSRGLRENERGGASLHAPSSILLCVCSGWSLDGFGVGMKVWYSR